MWILLVYFDGMEYSWDIVLIMGHVVNYETILRLSPWMDLNQYCWSANEDCNEILVELSWDVNRISCVFPHQLDGCKMEYLPVEILCVLASNNQSFLCN